MTRRGQVTISTTRLGLARALWFYGEDDLWPRSLNLPLPRVLDIGIRAGELHMTDYRQDWFVATTDGGVAGSPDRLDDGARLGCD